jgi:hypothetical protein
MHMPAHCAPLVLTASALASGPRQQIVHRAVAPCDRGSASKLNAERVSLCTLRDKGRRAADNFLSMHGEDLARRSTLDIDRLMPGV